MDLAQAVQSALSKYSTFTGRAPRSEYWYFTLFSVLATIAVNIIDAVILGRSFGSMLTLGNLLWLALLPPTISVTVRRLHDLDKSGWWWWIWMIPFIGWIIFLVWMVTKGSEGNNSFGTDPFNGFEEVEEMRYTHKSSIPIVRPKD